VEHEEAWADVVRRHIAGLSGVRLHVIAAEPAGDSPRAPSGKPGYEDRDFARYVAAISDVGGRFDLIVIDGRSRTACLAAAIGHLAPGGLIVFDNSRRRRYRDAITNAGLCCLQTRGLTACLPYPDATTLLSDNADVLAALGEEGH
jgi:hypothetical protein